MARFYKFTIAICMFFSFEAAESWDSKPDLKEQVNVNSNAISRLLYLLENNAKGTNRIVAFNARDVQNLRSERGETLIFKTNLMNKGNAYDSNTGVFTAPVAGLYLFTAQICTAPPQWFKASIMVGGHEYGRCISADKGYHVCGSCQATAIMKAGQTAFLRNIYGRGKRLYADPYRGLYFTGTLIKELGTDH